MHSFGLEKRHYDFILDNLKKYIPNAKYFIFGSRSKGNYQKYSDIDIAIDLNNEKLKADILAKIITSFQDSTLPYKVDIIDLNSIDENFKNIIFDDLKEIN